MNDLINKLFSFIPDHIDKNLRYLLIFLITLQFTSFLLYIFLSTKTYLKMRKSGQQDQCQEIDGDNMDNNNKENNDNSNKEKND
jgi:hypothetical protein